jgi:hypothetical protein
MAKTVRVYLSVKGDAITVDDFSKVNIRCKTFEEIVDAFAFFAKKVGYKHPRDVPADAWFWQNASSMDFPEEETQDPKILELVEQLMNPNSCDIDPRTV